MAKRLWAAFAVFAVSSFLFLTLDTRAGWDFILVFRGIKLVTMVTVGAAVALSTLLLQTLSANRILTPSIMGFDALFLLMQSVLVLMLGGLGYAQLAALPKFLVESLVLTLAAVLLFTLVLGSARDIAKVLLTGLIIGVMLRSLTGLINRVIDPSEYAILHGASFASFNQADPALAWIGAGVTAAVFLWAMSNHRALDVLALGREISVTLGLDHLRFTRRVLVAISLLVAVSTALVGPIVFFGLLVSALTYAFAGDWRHVILLPFAALCAASILILGQTLFEHVLALQSSVAIVIEAIGGAVFLLTLLMRKSK